MPLTLCYTLYDKMPLLLMLVLHTLPARRCSALRHMMITVRHSATMAATYAPRYAVHITSSLTRRVTRYVIIRVEVRTYAHADVTSPPLLIFRAARYYDEQGRCRLRALMALMLKDAAFDAAMPPLLMLISPWLPARGAITAFVVSDVVGKSTPRVSYCCHMR